MPSVRYFMLKHATDLSEDKEKSVSLWEASSINNNYMQRTLLGLKRQQMYLARNGFTR